MTNLLSFSNGANFFLIRFNEDSKYVRTVGGRKGTKGTGRTLHFATRAELRAYVDSRIAVKMAKGFRGVRPGRVAVETVAA